jgi:hypothetical protein
VEIKSNDAEARKCEAAGEASYIRETGAAKGAEVEAIGLARAAAYARQVEALGPTATAIVNLADSLAEGKNRFVPEVFVAGQGGSLEALGATLTRFLGTTSGTSGNGIAKPKATPPPLPVR